MIVLGKHSGRAAFADALAEDGHHTSRTRTSPAAFARFKELADRKGEIDEEGLRAIVVEEIGRASEQIHLVGIHVSGGNDEAPVAVVTMTERRRRASSPPTATAWSTPPSSPSRMPSASRQRWSTTG